jgi:hypothetical protein
MASDHASSTGKTPASQGLTPGILDEPPFSRLTMWVPEKIITDSAGRVQPSASEDHEKGVTVRRLRKLTDA